ncbi:MAG: flagellar hook-length control protein FliK [Aquificae bacterium]|nr:flagellar hook-length control protein FliK [Aquificota bacterium]
MINIKPLINPYEYIQITKPKGYSISLKVGEIVKAEVVDILPSGGVVIRMKGAYITVRTEIPLQKDSSLLLQILQLPEDNRLKISLLSVLNQKGQININKAEFSRLDIKSLASLIDIENVTEFEKIMLFQIIKEKISPYRNVIYPLSINSIYPDNLRYAVYNSGIFLESKLKNILKGKKEDLKNDIKANLLQQIEDNNLFHNLLQTNTKKKALLNDIYLYQLLSKLTESVYTYIPISLKQIKNFDFSYKREQNGGNFVKLDLSFEEKGRVLVIVTYYQNYLNIFFKFEDSDFKKQAENHIDKLKQKLSPIKINIFFIEDKVPFDRLETFEISKHLLDIKT